MSDAGDHTANGASLDDAEDFFERAPVGQLTMRTDGSIIRINDTLARWCGRAKVDLVEKNLQSMLTVGTRIFYETNVLPVLRMNGEFSEVTLELRTEAGPLPVFAHACLQQADDDRPAIVRVVFTKAGDRRRYELELLDARIAAKQNQLKTQTLLDDERETSQLREQFIAVLGHDLRNPLAAISGGMHLLKKDMSIDRRERIHAMVNDSVLRMEGLIDNVLDFARGRLGTGIPLELRPHVLLGPVLEQLVSELRLGGSGRVIETEINLPSPVKCDPSRISQLVSNLLGNALTHGAAGQPVRIFATQDDRTLKICVENMGLPIPPLAMERLFQPFFRGEVRSSQQGLGLGLHIASEIAKAHQADLYVESTLEVTRFKFEMKFGGA